LAKINKNHDKNNNNNKQEYPLANEGADEEVWLRAVIVFGVACGQYICILMV
jgi:hypothetical protein